MGSVSKSRNRYAYPVKINSNTAISYDESPAHKGNLRFAVDFVVPEDTPVLASADGVVVDLKQDSDIGGPEKNMEQFGNFVEIQHANDEYSEYEHLRKNGVEVKIGDKVKSGQTIGYSGATGWLAHLGPHLHFMVGKYGKIVDDYQTLEICWEANSQ